MICFHENIHVYSRRLKPQVLEHTNGFFFYGCQDVCNMLSKHSFLSTCLKFGLLKVNYSFLTVGEGWNMREEAKMNS
jgi:hypothetical protein